MWWNDPVFQNILGSLLVIVAGYVAANLHVMFRYLLGRVKTLPIGHVLATKVLNEVESVVRLVINAVLQENKDKQLPFDTLVKLILTKVWALVPELDQWQKDFEGHSILAIIETFVKNELNLILKQQQTPTN
jgi:hypothetical protein